MPAQKFLTVLSGVKTLISAILTSAGAGDSGKIPALDSSGKLDNSFMPVGLGAETDSVVVDAGGLAGGDFVNLYDATGTLKARKADATTAGKEAHGFVLSAYSSGATATIYRCSQSNTALTGLTIGATYYLSTTAGQATTTAPSTTGNVVQVLGVAVAATKLSFNPGESITLA